MERISSTRASSGRQRSPDVPATMVLQPADPTYPAERLKAAEGDNCTLAAMGDVDLLARRRVVALFCSVRCPGELIVKTYDLARNLRDGGVTVVGGFQSPMERECLELLLRGRQPVVVCPARGLDNMRLPSPWKKAMAEGRLLVVSPFGGQVRRPTEKLAMARNELVAALADEVLIAYAEPGGKTEAFARKVLDWGKPLLTLESGRNANLVALGARVVTAEGLVGHL